MPPLKTATVFSERDQQNAELIGLLLLHAKMLQALGRNRLTGDSANSMHWIHSMVAHGAQVYGDGQKLEADTLALARSLGMIVDQVIVSEPHPSQAGLVH